MRVSAWVLLSLLAGAAVARGGFVVISHSARPDPASRITTFSVEFSQPPDFVTRDSAGRAANEFSWYYSSHVVADADPETNLYDDPDLLQLSGAFGQEHDRVIVRRYQDWRELNWVRFELDGTRLTLPVSWADLYESDTGYRYDLETYEFGATASSVSAQSVPLPAAIGPAASLLAAALLAGAVRSRLRQRERR